MLTVVLTVVLTDCGGHIFPAKSSRQPTCCGDLANVIRLQRIPHAKLVTTWSFIVVKYCPFPFTLKQNLPEKNVVAEFTTAVWACVVHLLESCLRARPRLRNRITHTRVIYIYIYLFIYLFIYRCTYTPLFHSYTHSCISLRSFHPTSRGYGHR